MKRLLSRMVRYATSWRGGVVIGVFLVWVVLTMVLADSLGTGLLLVGGLAVATAASIVLLAGDDVRIRRNLRIAKGAVANRGYVADADRDGSGPELYPIVSETGAQPDVTVVVTAWNDARFIADAIASLKLQTLTSWRCVIVDDASTDDTTSVVLQAIGDDHRFTLVANDENRGLAVSRNLGVAEATSEFVCFLDGDDFLYPDSLASRVKALRGHADRAWVAGVYCQWKNVPEKATVATETPKPGPRRKKVTWLESLRDAPFIATAPLMKKKVLEAVGGFPSVRTAEDALFWNAVLRQGFVFEAVHEVGVAYRAKRLSMYRDTAVQHAQLISESLAANALPMEGQSVGPYPFREGCESYVWNTTLVRRLIMALASAVEAVDEDGIRTVAGELSDRLEPYHLWELPVEQAVAHAASRVCRYLPDSDMDVRKAAVVQTITHLLEPEIARLMQQVSSSMELGTHLHQESRPRLLSISDRLEISSDLLSGAAVSLVDGKVLLMPGASYHVSETGPLAEEMAVLGLESVVMVSDSTWTAIVEAQASYTSPVLATPEPGDWIQHLAGVVVMNDWGNQWQPTVMHANKIGVPTFGKVEGVQDFKDDDAHRVRGAYTRVGTVLAQGQNDVDALPEQRTVVVSNSRLERIWLDPVRNVDGELAIVNLNFTFSVLDDARDFWLSSIDQAMQQVGMNYLVSLHPEERDRYRGRYPIAADPMRHLLTKASVLVSRFSTVPFEAMARGVPFIYHNPHGERVPTFQNPDGAFDVTQSAGELVLALEQSRLEQEIFRGRSAQFFLRQVDVDLVQSSSQRAARAIADTLRM